MLASLLALTLLFGCGLLVPVTPAPLRGRRETGEPPSASTSSDITTSMVCALTLNRTSRSDNELIQDGVRLTNRLLTNIENSLQTMRTERFHDDNYRVVTQTEETASLCQGSFSAFLTVVYAGLQYFSASLAAVQDLYSRQHDFSVPRRLLIQMSTESLGLNVRSLAGHVLETPSEDPTAASSTAAPSQLQLRTSLTPYELDRSTLALLERYQIFINATKTVYMQLQKQNSEAESE
ncbi:uncharacterized protein LOC144881729 [Branchiostoma floridae x Branchiostoma japonicum]